ncbi:3-oxoacyl-[acyl-carrier-protein] synthase III C-terminal domain-containing protein [Paenibacillus sp. An7]|uniref:3-oxoacyl-[acyl-carrier-protein] synthase III C-terminal domain-containing protein n=1 Tax=Paenibacillus sp. An7 TaxID=2689577 RepID=UPI00135AE1CB|nr:3-oxoacyl-[acyl-carrier-protein] synthase III C-terminal domain-containing protein [Paenibacillus sp. An7]
MIFIKKIWTYIPETTLEIQQLNEHLSLKKAQVKVLEKIHGLKQIRKDQQGNLFFLLDRIFEQITVDPDLDLTSIKYIIYCHTIQEIFPYNVNVIRELKIKYDLEHAVIFSLTQQNCATGIMAIDIAKRLLNSMSENEHVLLLTGEKTFSPVVQFIPNTTVMGEASAAVLLGLKDKGNQLVHSKHHTIGKFCNVLTGDEETLKEFQEIYVPTLCRVIEDTLQEAGLSIQDISWIIPHNVNISSWKKVATTLSFPLDRIYLDNVATLGHCFCSDPFINLQEALLQSKIQREDYYLLVSVGLGATFSVAIMKN